MRMMLATALFALVGCGSGTPSGSRLMGDSNHVFLAVFGGNSSCKVDDDGVRGPRGMDMFVPFTELSDRLTTENHWNVSWLITCHNSDASVKWVSSDAPTTMQSMTIAEVAPKIQALVQENAPGHVFLAGHSYGGWLSLKTGLAVTQDVRIEGLFSIDPISRPNCTFSNPAECTQFPSDVTPAQRLQLKDRTDVWTNFYQTQTSFLHSSPATEADENVRVATGHTGIDTHSDVWAPISNRIARALAY